MRDRREQSRVSFCNLTGTSFDLYLNKSTVFFFDNAVHAVVIDQGQINIQTFHKHFSDKVSATAIRRSAAGSGASKYCYALLFAGMLVASLLCIVRAVGGDSIFHLLVPMCIVVLVLLLYSLTRWRLWFLLGASLVLCYAVLMLQNALAATDFGYAPLLALVPLYLSSILPLFSLAVIK